MTVIRGEKIYPRDPRKVNSPVVLGDSSDTTVVDMPGVPRNTRDHWDIPTYIFQNFPFGFRKKKQF